MKKNIIVGLLISILFSSLNIGCCFAIAESGKIVPAQQKTIKAQNVYIAFVFDSKSDKTEQLIKVFQPKIKESLLPEYNAIFSNNLIFKGDWTQKGANVAAEKALRSNAKIIVSFGCMASKYLKSKPNKSKYIIHVDKYTIDGVGSKAFNPIQQTVNDFVVFNRLVPKMKKTAILMNENTLKMRSDWSAILTKAAKDKNVSTNYYVIPVTNNIQATINKITSGTDSVYITQLYNLTREEKKQLFNAINDKKLPSFSAMGREDVELGVLFGTSAVDADKKLAEATSFSIKNVLKGNAIKNEDIQIFDNNILSFNKDTADKIGYVTHIRLLKSADVISTKMPNVHNLTYVFQTFDKQNLSVQRKKYLINAAQRSLTSAYLHYLPTLRLDLGYQTYNKNYAYSYNDVPTSGGVFTTAMDQVLYSPDLVTNIIVKHKKLNFSKAECVLTQQNMGLNIALLYIGALKLQNEVAIQREYIKEVQSNLAIAKTKLLYNKGTKAEVARWSSELNDAEEQLLILSAEDENVKIKINEMLNTDQTEQFVLAPLTAKDPAFFMSDINLLDHIRTPEKMEKAVSMLAKEASYLAPETTKLKLAIAMKKAEIGNYAQKFVLPNAKLSLEYGSQFSRDLPYEGYLSDQIGTLRRYFGDGNSNALEKNSTRFYIAAQWKPIEGGTKIAEIARTKSELNELNTYLNEVNIELESQIRTIVNRAIARYLCIERAYKRMYASEANYKEVKYNYLKGNAPITQELDAIKSAYQAKVDAQNAQYEFYKEVIWLQRGLASVNWSNATDDAKNFIKRLKTELEAENDINVNL